MVYKNLTIFRSFVNSRLTNSNSNFFESTILSTIITLIIINVFKQKRQLKNIFNSNNSININNRRFISISRVKLL